eukprot:2811682-Rhodomonas_salina.1
MPYQTHRQILQDASAKTTLCIQNAHRQYAIPVPGNAYRISSVSQYGVSHRASQGYTSTGLRTATA